MADASTFSEHPVWEGIVGEWRKVFGGFDEVGVSVEWHDFESSEEVAWGKSFHPDSLEICVNLAGTAAFPASHELIPSSMTFYWEAPPASVRRAGMRHRFLTIEMTRKWLAPRLGQARAVCPDGVKAFLDGEAGPLPEPLPLTGCVRKAVEDMLRPPGALLAVWYPAKILEVASHVFSAGELFCERHQRVSRERVERVKAILARNLEYPPPLAEIAREVGCSPFHLSRIFSDVTGTTITRYLRVLRLERAAELLRSGSHNVTEAAMEVGYSSLSHFSKAFAAQFGHCPCVFPLKRQ